MSIDAQTNNTTLNTNLKPDAILAKVQKGHCLPLLVALHVQQALVAVRRFSGSIPETAVHAAATSPKDLGVCFGDMLLDSEL